MKQNRRRTVNQSLKNLRAILGMTQPQFAALVGVSLQLIKGVETGQFPLAKGLARKIQMATGAVFSLPHIEKHRGTYRRLERPVKNGDVKFFIRGEGMAYSLMDSKRVRSGEEYTPEHFEVHRRFFQTNHEAAKLALKEVMPAIEAVFAAAAKPGVAGMKHRLPGLRASLWDWIREANRAFKLNVQI
jgi:DNA-binding XRE family transcriptional regulator